MLVLVDKEVLDGLALAHSESSESVSTQMLEQGCISLSQPMPSNDVAPSYFSDLRYFFLMSSVRFIQLLICFTILVPFLLRTVLQNIHFTLNVLNPSPFTSLNRAVTAVFFLPGIFSSVAIDYIMSLLTAHISIYIDVI